LIVAKNVCSGSFGRNTSCVQNIFPASLKALQSTYRTGAQCHRQRSRPCISPRSFPVLKTPQLNRAGLQYYNQLDQLTVKQMLKYLAFCGTPRSMS
jgi:hypothetical protein